MSPAGLPPPESNDDDPIIPPHEVRRMIRRMVAGLAARTDRAPGDRPPSPTDAGPRGRRPRQGTARIVIKGFDPADPRLAEVIAELEAKRADAQAVAEEGGGP